MYVTYVVYYSTGRNHRQRLVSEQGRLVVLFHPSLSAQWKKSMETIFLTLAPTFPF